MIGRDWEWKQLENAFSSEKPQVVVLSGRLGVGKSHFVKEFFAQKKCHVIHATGVEKGNMFAQLKSFTKGYSAAFFNSVDLQVPRNWLWGLSMLDLNSERTQGKIVIIFDELQVMATRRSELLEEIARIWKRDWKKSGRVMVVICSSSPSWVQQKLLDPQFNLASYITLHMQLKPFTLEQSQQFLDQRGLDLSKEDMLSLYMTLGGIPRYLQHIEPGLKPQDAIQALFFGEHALLHNELTKVLSIAFEKPAPYKELIDLTAQSAHGLTRSELAQRSVLSTRGGRLSQRLEGLCALGLLEEVLPWGKQRGEFYRVADELSLFLGRWISPSEGRTFPKKYWQDTDQSHEYYDWAAYAFKSVCRNNKDALIKALGIKVAYAFGWWRSPAAKDDVLDLIFDMDKKMLIGLCMYAEKVLTLDKEYASKLICTIELFKKKAQVSKPISLAMITPLGVEKTSASKGLIDQVITLNDLLA